MGRMPVEKVGQPFGQTVVVGPCPGCFCWQVEYDTALFTSITELHETVESVLQEHLEECSGLQEIVRTLL